MRAGLVGRPRAKQRLIPIAVDPFFMGQRRLVLGRAHRLTVLPCSKQQTCVRSAVARTDVLLGMPAETASFALVDLICSKCTDLPSFQPELSGQQAACLLFPDVMTLHVTDTVAASHFNGQEEPPRKSTDVREPSDARLTAVSIRSHRRHQRAREANQSR